MFCKIKAWLEVNAIIASDSMQSPTSKKSNDIDFLILNEVEIALKVIISRYFEYILCYIS